MRLRDTLVMSLGSLVSHKLRSVLTLVGIVAGIASIIAVMTAIAVVQATIEREMSVLGAQTFQVQKWPAGGFNSVEEQRKAMLRPPVTVAHANAIREQVQTVDLVGAERVMLGTDRPYDMGEPDPVALVNEVEGLSDAERDMIMSGTAKELLKMN